MWTVSTLRAYFEALLVERDRRYEQRFADQQRAVEAALRAAKDAVDKAEAATEKRFEAVNEFRGQLADQAHSFVPRIELDGLKKDLDKITDGRSELMRVDIYEQQHHDLVARVASVEQWRTTVNARMGVIIGISALGAGSIGALIGHLIK